MENIAKEQLIECFKPFFKLNGFKKTRTSWRKSKDELIFVLNIQGSQWNKEDYYINVGIYFKALEAEQNPPEYKSHIRSRIDVSDKSCTFLCNEILEWFETHGTIQKLKLLRNQDSLPLATRVNAKKYLDEIN